MNNDIDHGAEAPDPEEIHSEAHHPENAAFLSALAGYVFMDVELQPFSALRQAAALAMGLRYGMLGSDDFITLTFPDEKEESGQREIQVYRQVFSDTIIVLWLMHQPDSVAHRALRNTSNALREAMRWADAQRIGINSPAFNEAMELFLRIMGDIRDSQSTPKIKTGSGKGAASGNA